MKKLKTVLLSMMLIAAMVVCSSCMQANLQVKIKEDGSSAFSMTTLLSKDDLNEIKSAIYPQMLAIYGSAETADIYMEKTFGEIESWDLVTVDGKEYYKYANEQSFKNMKELAEELESMSYFGGVSVGTDHFYAATVMDDAANGTIAGISQEELNAALSVYGLTIEQITKMVNDIKIAFTIEFPNSITYSNGKFEPGSNQVTWELNEFSAENISSDVQIFYAETMNPSVLLNDKTAPAVTGIKNNGIYSKGTVTVTDQVGVAGIKVDGESVIMLNDLTEGSTSTATLQKKVYKLQDLPSGQGKHTMKIFDLAGNKTTITYTYDTQKPTVKGVASGKTYKKARTIKFSDKYGIKSAKLNGKTIKNNKKVSKKGSYTLKVTDKAGNVTTVKFKIKK